MARDVSCLSTCAASSDSAVAVRPHRRQISSSSWMTMTCARQVRPFPEHSDLRAVAHDAVVELAPLIAGKRLEFALDGEALCAPADAFMLGELLRNLLAN